MDRDRELLKAFIAATRARVAPFGDQPLTANILLDALEILAEEMQTALDQLESA